MKILLEKCLEQLIVGVLKFVEYTNVQFHAAQNCNIKFIIFIHVNKFCSDLQDSFFLYTSYNETYIG